MVTGAEHAGPNAQWIDLDVPVNFRDLGGNQTENGAVRRGLVYRSDSLVGLTDSDVRHLTVDLGIRTVLDLRSESETRNGRTELADQGTAYYHLPIGRRLGSIRRRGTKVVTMAEGYLAMFEASGQSLTDALEILSNRASRPLVFHCAGGKDRAGLMAATLLATLGATPDTIASDYALTSTRFDRVLARLTAEPQYRDVIGQIDPESLTAEPATMLDFLELITAKHRSLLDDLIGHGLAQASIQQLRADLISSDVATESPS